VRIPVAKTSLKLLLLGSFPCVIVR
jgi:hypothetical protein